MHGEDWDGKQDLNEWWISEKMDGIRAYWNGKNLISRQAKEIPCPQWFIEGFPPGQKLDGELWMGRGRFHDLMSIFHSNGEQELWKEVKYVIFDMLITETPYESRMQQARMLELPPHATVVDMETCMSQDHLMNCLNKIVKDGGEGIVLTQPQSFYVAKRTPTRLKVKVRYYYN
jgi:DNA ligase-1